MATPLPADALETTESSKRPSGRVPWLGLLLDLVIIGAAVGVCWWLSHESWPLSTIIGVQLLVLWWFIWRITGATPGTWILTSVFGVGRDSESDDEQSSEELQQAIEDHGFGAHQSAQPWYETGAAQPTPEEAWAGPQAGEGMHAGAALGADAAAQERAGMATGAGIGARAGVVGPGLAGPVPASAQAPEQAQRQPRHAQPGSSQYAQPQVPSQPQVPVQQVPAQSVPPQVSARPQAGAPLSGGAQPRGPVPQPGRAHSGPAQHGPAHPAGQPSSAQPGPAHPAGQQPTPPQPGAARPGAGMPTGARPGAQPNMGVAPTPRVHPGASRPAGSGLQYGSGAQGDPRARRAAAPQPDAGTQSGADKQDAAATKTNQASGQASKSGGAASTASARDQLPTVFQKKAPEPESIDDTRIADEVEVPTPPTQLLLPDGRSEKLAGKMLVGRKPTADNDEKIITIVDEQRSISRTHFSIEVMERAVLLTDLGSANGTRLQRDGHELTLSAESPVALLPDDEIRIGRFTLRLR